MHTSEWWNIGGVAHLFLICSTDCRFDIGAIV